MRVDFSSIHNHHEKAVIHAVLTAAPGYPGLADNHELLADVACVALNRLPPRYIRHDVDLSFYETEERHLAHEKAIHDAVTHAFGFVQTRNALGARA